MSSGHHVDDSKAAAILTDVTKCEGCQKCVIACVEVNDTGDPVPYVYSNPDGLSGSRWTSILDIKDEEKGISRFVRKHCLHCKEPSCVGACLVGALTKNEEGAVVYNNKKCIGCRYCMLACPFSIPRYQWETPIPFVRKCILCADTRLAEGKEPGCTSACPYGATIFGTREEMLAEAHKRIMDNPGKYIDRVWGEDDFGGTNVLYISDVSLEELGFPVTEAEKAQWKGQSIPEWTAPVVRATPYIFFGVYPSLFGISWIINRRIKLAEEEKRKNPNRERDIED